MTLLRKLLLVFALLVVALAAWLWFTRPQPIDMADYVPADAIIFIEANSLTDIASGLAATDAWRALAAPAGIEGDFGHYGWLSQVIKWTGAGPAQAVVLSRAQVAVVVLDFKAEEETGDTLKITPRAALVAETHTGASRARAALEKLVGDFARRVYGSPRTAERKNADGSVLLTWASPTEPQRRIVAAVSESTVVVGNDESVVEACLATKRGERPALSSDEQLAAMRERMNAPNALAFGYVPRGRASKLLEVTALAYVGQLSSDQRVQSVVASLLPQFATRVLSNAAWSTRVKDGAVEDSYFLALQNGVAARLGSSLSPTEAPVEDATTLLPADAFQFSRYCYRDPLAAWRGFNVALSSQLDALSAPFVGKLLEEALKPYGIEAPREFLNAAGPEMVTARLDASGASTVLVVAVRDREALEKQVRKHLGGGTRTVAVGDAQMLVSTDEEERGAASFVGGLLIMGREAQLRRCLEARAQGRTLAASDRYRRAPHKLFEAPPAVVTFSDDRETTRAFVNYIARQSASRDKRANSEAFERALESSMMTVSESRFTQEGLEKVTRSAFGNFGTLVMRFAPETKER